MATHTVPHAVLSSQSPQNHWQLFFDQHGCLICGQKHSHVGYGLCASCRDHAIGRLTQTIRETR